jgi:hypothetical protein
LHSLFSLPRIEAAILISLEQQYLRISSRRITAAGGTNEILIGDCMIIF